MARCKAYTKKNERCRREAMAGSDVCSTHKDVDVSGSGGSEWAIDELSDGTRAVLGLATIGTIVYLALKMGRRW